MKKKGQVKKKKLKLRVKVIVKILLFLSIIILSAFYVLNLPIKNIYITGNEVVKDITIIKSAKIENYPKIYKLKLNKLKSQIKTIPLIEDVKIKRNLFGKITIDVTESKVLFYYEYNNKMITSEGKSIENDNSYLGFPTLINFTPDTIFNELYKGLNKIDYNIIKMINEIEYTPYKDASGKVIDETRFTLRMNDNNAVIIDTVNIKRLNDYIMIYTSLNMDVEKGILHLDTITKDSIYFKKYEEITEDNPEKDPVQVPEENVTE